MIDYDKYVWAKSEPFCLLSHHMIAVGACAEVYLSSPSASAIRQKLSEWMGLSEEDTIKGIAYAFSLHDIGKAHPSFQYRKEDVYDTLRSLGIKDFQAYGEAGFRHECYGANVLRTIWKRKQAGFPGQASELLAAVIRLHHQGKAQNSGNRLPMNSGWAEIQCDLEDRMRRVFAPEVSAPSLRNVDALGMLLTALLVLFDWVASSDAFGDSMIEEDHAYRMWADTRARSVLIHFGLISDVQTAYPMNMDFCGFWPSISRDGMRPLQRACETGVDASAALTIIEAPPGEGKTEAALYLAGQICRQRGLHGIYMALPTAATSNQMVERVRALLKDHGIEQARLLHSTAWMIDNASATPEELSLDDDARQASDWLRPLRRGMLSENAVGTVDQAMASVLRIKYGMLRLAGLSEKVLIIDEIHAYDAYMSRIIERLLQWCRALRIPVILLSATLQRLQRERYIKCYAALTEQALCDDYPVITQVSESGQVLWKHVDGSYVHTQYHFKPAGILGDIAKIAEMAQHRTRYGGCLCVMMNTVHRAQQVYLELKRRGENSVMIFHARYRMGRRAEIEQECLQIFGKHGRRPDRMILVCTQVVEQSLDLDFDGMITELAPVDLLIQRAGRVHRHEGTHRPDGFKKPEVIVLLPTDSASIDLEKRYMPFSTIYAPCLLHTTEHWLDKGRTVHMPEDVRQSIEQVYEVFDDDAIEAFVQMTTGKICAEAAADAGLYNPPEYDRFFGRIPSNDQLINLEEEEDLGGMLQRKGAKTRDGLDSVCVAFLPKDYHPINGNALEQARDVMRFTCSIHLTEHQKNDTMINIKGAIKDNKYLRNCILLPQEEDGGYMLAGEKYYADDVIGIWKEERLK